MKLHSAYLNPFQPIAERNSRDDDEGHCRTALENNMTRSVLSALANAADAKALAMFLRALAPHGSEALRVRLEKIVETLQALGPDDWSRLEVDLLTKWPVDPAREREQLDVLLIGISSHHANWTPDGRCASDTCLPDAWVYLPGRLLLVFECKNDKDPLDATQISEYVHRLALTGDPSGVPRAARGAKLTPEEAKKVQSACRDVVLDVPWSAVVEALSRIAQTKEIDGPGPWLCRQAAAYLDRHTYPPYRGFKTILDWLKGPDEPDRRRHLRTLVGKLGQSLAESASLSEGGITFAKSINENVDLPSGGGSAVYVALARDGLPLQIPWAGDKKLHLVLWFDFAEGADDEQLIGLSYYRQASGSDARGKQSKAAWNRASKRHEACARRFETEVQDWIRNKGDTQMIVGTVRFRGRSQMWKGGGTPGDGPTSGKVSAQAALQFLKDHRAELWRYPRVGPGEEASIAEAAAKVRKPAVSLRIPLSVDTLVKSGEDGQLLQRAFQNALQSAVDFGEPR